NSASPLLPLPTRGRLASRAPPSHLLGARRFHCFCHRKQNNGRVEPEIPAPATVASAGDALSSHEMERNPGLVGALGGSFLESPWLNCLWSERQRRRLPGWPSARATRSRSSGWSL